MKVSFVINVDLKYSYRATERMVYEYAKYLLDHRIKAEVLVGDLRGIPFNSRTPQKQRQDWNKLRKRLGNVPTEHIGGFKISFPFEYAPMVFYKHLPRESIIYMPFNIFSYALNALTKPANQSYVISTYGMNLRKKRVHGALLQAANKFTSTILFWLLLHRAETRKNIYYHAINSTHRDYLLNFDVPERNIFFIPLALNTKNYKPKINESMHTGRLRLIHIGGTDKNVDVVLDIIKELIRIGKLDDFEFNFIGAREPEELLDYVKNHKNIHYFGPIGDSEKAMLLPKMDAMLVPDKIDNFGITTLEALSCGLYPILSIYHLGAKDMKATGANLYVADDASAYVNQLIKLHAMKKNRNLFNRGRIQNIKVSKSYDYNSIFPRIKEMFEKVARGEPASK